MCACSPKIIWLYQRERDYHHVSEGLLVFNPIRDKHFNFGCHTRLAAVHSSLWIDRNDSANIFKRPNI